MSADGPFEVVLEPQPGGGYTVYAPDLPGCISEGQTEEEALVMIRDAMAAYLASRREHGWPVPEVLHRKVTPA